MTYTNIFIISISSLFLISLLFSYAYFETVSVPNATNDWEGAFSLNENEQLLEKEDTAQVKIEYTSAEEYYDSVESVFDQENIVSSKSCDYGGQIIESGVSQTYYKDPLVPFGSECISQVRVCSNGALSGQYSNPVCIVDAEENQLPESENPDAPVNSKDSCNFLDQEIVHGDQIVLYQKPLVPFGTSCRAEVRICNDGTLLGSYTHSTCAKDDPRSCAVGGIVLPHGTSKFFYNKQNGSCLEQQRTCNNGTVSGSFVLEDCDS